MILTHYIEEEEEKKVFKDEIFETPHFSGTFKITRFELRKMTTAILEQLALQCSVLGKVLQEFTS